jgi:flagellar basal-body rod modification protein FlgD
MSNLNVDLMSQLGLATAPSGSANSSVTGAGGGQLNQSDFLKLMTTQLNNQDPTQPSDSSQMLAQMAQLSTVSGIQAMQSSLQQLVNTMMASQTTQAAGLVGHQVIAAGSSATLTPNGMGGAIELTQDTQKLTVGIYDSSGQLVKQVNMGPQSKGTVPFSWSGITDNGDTAPNGVYQIRASAQVNGANQAMSTYVASTVDSVNVDAVTQNLSLNMSSGDSIKISDIKQLM